MPFTDRDKGYADDPYRGYGLNQLIYRPLPSFAEQQKTVFARVDAPVEWMKDPAEGWRLCHWHALSTPPSRELLLANEARMTESDKQRRVVRFFKSAKFGREVAILWMRPDKDDPGLTVEDFTAAPLE